MYADGRASLTYSTLYGMIRSEYKGCYAGRQCPASRDYRDKRSYRLSADKWLVHGTTVCLPSCPKKRWRGAG